MIKYRVHYKKDNYNPYKTYARNANRYAACKVVDTLEEAREFAATVKNAEIYTTTGVKVR
jgi:hypothetical protein